MIKVAAMPLPNAFLPWLIGALALALLLHSSYLSVGFWLVAGLFIAWRWLIGKGKLPYPKKYLKTMTVALVLLLLASQVDGFNLESASTFLLATSLLKLIELRTLRDGYIAVFLNFFVLATGFLFTQDILSALLALAVVLLLLVCLNLMHYSTDAPLKHRQLLLQASKLMLLSLPMMLVLYLLFPRFGPLWSWSLQSGQAKTGLSDTMAAADIAEISQSSELAFRASFADNQVPARQELYWRALVLDYYDGRQWSVKHRASITWQTQTEQRSSLNEYEIIQEPHDKNWLFALSNPLAIEARTGVTDDQRLVSRRPVHQRLRYQVGSVQTKKVIPLSSSEYRRYLQLPRETNPAAQSWAQQQAQDAPQQTADSIMQMFAQQEFYYTLKPQTYGRNEIDEFLFERRQGFCAHYAGAMVFLARAAGIPARVVTGYQGGEWNAQEHFLTVRQYDAHAWVELWFEDIGWQQYDPTAMVAADRILYGLEQAVANEGTFLQGQLSVHRFKQIGWINQLRNWSAQAEYAWQKWVLSYDHERQSNFLENVLKLKSYQQGLYILAGSFVLFFIIGSVVLWWRLRPAPSSALVQAWRQLQQQGMRLQLAVAAGESVSQYMQRCQQQWPSLQAQCTEIQQLADSALYQPQTARTATEQELILALRQLTRSMKKIKH